MSHYLTSPLLFFSPIETCGPSFLPLISLHIIPCGSTSLPNAVCTPQYVTMWWNVLVLCCICFGGLEAWMSPPLCQPILCLTQPSELLQGLTVTRVTHYNFMVADVNIPPELLANLKRSSPHRSYSIPPSFPSIYLFHLSLGNGSCFIDRTRIVDTFKLSLRPHNDTFQHNFQPQPQYERQKCSYSHSRFINSFGNHWEATESYEALCYMLGTLEMRG